MLLGGKEKRETRQFGDCESEEDSFSPSQPRGAIKDSVKGEAAQSATTTTGSGEVIDRTHENGQHEHRLKETRRTRATRSVSEGYRCLDLLPLRLSYLTHCQEHLQEETSDFIRSRSEGSSRVQRSKKSFNES